MTTTSLAIALIGTDVSADGRRLSPQSQAIAHRGAALIAEYLSSHPLVIPTGGNGSVVATTQSGLEAELMTIALQELLSAQEIDPTKLTLLPETNSHNTLENAFYTLDTIRQWEKTQQQTIEHLIVVSWQPHSGRVRLTFNEVMKLQQRQFTQVDYLTVEAPYGSVDQNSQPRLTSPVQWLFWNWVIAYPITRLLLCKYRLRGKVSDNS